MTSRKNINIFDFNGMNVAKHWHVAGEVFAISDCLVYICDTIFCIFRFIYIIGGDARATMAYLIICMLMWIAISQSG